MDLLFYFIDLQIKLLPVLYCFNYYGCVVYLEISYGNASIWGFSG